MNSGPESGSLAEVVSASSVLVCCGPGGVGKTTVAAALALALAGQGRRVAVVTVDPARRLADALGLSGPEPDQVELGDVPRLLDGDWPGELWAVMLDPRSTFDSLVQTYATSPDQARTILANRFYRNIAGALSGTQEYMAMEKLHELASSGRYDVVVVDTPPSRDALDFIDAPRRLIRFLDNRLTRIVLFPTRASMRAVNLAAQGFLRSVSKVVGSEVVGEAVEFFGAFEGMEDGFRRRAAAVSDLLGAPATAFILVTSPRGDALAETSYFARELAATGRAVSGLVVNRSHPTFATPEVGASQVGSPEAGGAPGNGGLAALRANLADLAARHAAESDEVERLCARLGIAAVGRVPLLDSDVCDLSGLARVGRYVLAA